MPKSQTTAHEPTKKNESDFGAHSNSPESTQFYAITQNPPFPDLPEIAPKIPYDSRKKLLMPLVGLSLPERSGGDTPHQEHSQHMPPSFPMPGVYAKVLYI